MNISSVDQYIQSAPDHVRPILQSLRTLIKELVVDVEEKIVYGMPTYVYLGNLIHFAYHNKHIGIYPGPSGVLYALTIDPTLRHSKGALTFLFDETIPMELIKSMIMHRKHENEESYAMKSSMKKKII